MGWRFWRAAASVVSLAAASCGTYQQPAIRLALNPWPGYEFLSLAEELGYFTAENVHIELVEFTSLSDGRRAYERGLVDGITGTIAEVVIARDQSHRKPVVVIAADYSAGADVVIARSGIGAPAQLKGKRIGVEPASLGMLMATRLLEAGRLAPAEVQIQSVGPETMERQLRAGQLDAIITYPPYSTSAARLPGARVIFDSRAIPEQVLDVVAIDEEVTRSRRAEVLALRRAWTRAMRYFETHRADAVRRMARRERMSPEEFEEALAGLHLIDPASIDRFLAPGGPVGQASGMLEQVLLAAGTIGGR